MEFRSLDTMKNKILLGNSNENNLFENVIDILEYRNSKSFKLDKSNRNIEIDAVYNIENDPIVFIKKIKEKDEKKILKIHREMWNLNQAPISILILPNEIRIYNNYIPPENKEKFLFPVINATNIENIENLLLLTESEIRSGNIFTLLEKKFTKVNRVDRHLLTNLDNARSILHKKNKMPYDLAHNLLARSIFVKYLEDRGVLTSNTFSKYKVDNFTELLGNLNVEKLYDFFEELKKRFNGDLFKINPKEKAYLNSLQLDTVYSFFKGTELSTGQLSIFPYDFSIIPVELISNIYETFLNKNNKESKSTNGVFYTPYFLADFVLSYSLDNEIQDKDTYKIKILDPACGSGIFLVESFRRLVDKYIEKNNLINPADLVEIMEKYIFGIDLSEEAIQISSFSLYIALLDYIEPRDIEMNNIKFPNLIGKNLFVGDFFQENAEFNGLEFDFIIGNPPWASSKGKDKVLHEEYCEQRNIPISDRQIAYSFMARVKDFSHENTVITLIVTSKFLYNHTARKFRTYMLSNFQFNFVIELSLCRDIIFNKAAGPAAIICYKNNKIIEDIDSVISYYSIKPNVFAKILKKIVIDASEILEIKQSEFEKRDSLWKTIFFGNMFDSYLIKKLQQNETFEELASKYNLVFGQGFKKGTPKRIYEYLENKKFISTKIKNNYLYRYYVDFDNAPELKDVYLECPGKIEVYNAPHLLIKRGMSSDNRCVASTLLENAVFTNSINAVTGPNDLCTIELFYYLEGIINSKLYSYYHFHTSTSWAIERDEVLIKEHKEAPIISPERDSFLSRNVIEKVKSIKIEIAKLNENKKILIDKELFTDTSIIEAKIGEGENKIQNLQREIDEIVYELYDIDQIEKDTIENTHNILMNIFRKGYKSETLKAVDNTELEKYISIFINHFDYILKKDKKSLQVEVYQSSNFFIAINFKFVELNEYSHKKICYKKEFNGKYLDMLGINSIQEISYDVYINKKIRGFTPHSFYIIKTNERKNWSIMSARIDLNDFMSDMFSMKGGI